MKSTVEQLTFKEQEILAEWYDTPSYKVVRKLIDIERMELAKSHVNVQDILVIRHLSGQTEGLKKFIATVHHHYKSKESAKVKNKKS